MNLKARLERRVGPPRRITLHELGRPNWARGLTWRLATERLGYSPRGTAIEQMLDEALRQEAQEMLRSSRW